MAVKVLVGTTVGLLPCIGATQCIARDKSINTSPPSSTVGGHNWGPLLLGWQLGKLLAACHPANQDYRDECSPWQRPCQRHFLCIYYLAYGSCNKDTLLRWNDYPRP